jgi:transcriptional regulator with XRE-family HTH domain
MDAKTLKTQFGRRVRSLRKLRDLTQEQLAEAADMSPEYVGKIERGQSSPSFDAIAHLASALDVEPAGLFDFSELSGP